MTLLSLERHEDRPDKIRFSAEVEYGPSAPGGSASGGEPLHHTFNLFYTVEPEAAKVAADLEALEQSLDLFLAVREQVKNDARAEDVCVRVRGGVRVLLSNRTCPRGCRVDSLGRLPEVLARTPAVKPKLSVAEVLSLMRGD